MTESIILEIQMAALAQKLLRARAAVNSREFDTKAVTSKMRQDVRDQFLWQFNNSVRTLEDLQQKITSQSLEKTWEEFLELQKECQPLFRECLAFVEGALLRGAGFDNQLCLVADALITDLSKRAAIPWGRFTIMAMDEFFSDLADIIRLRFPDFDILQLPVAVHELGHFIGDKINNVMKPPPFEKILEEEGNPKAHQAFSFLHEQFADLFAVYVLGPAYACTCILRNFEPAGAHQDGKYHPAVNKRVFFILKALEFLDQDFTKPYSAIRNHLEHWWEQNLQAVGIPWPPDQADIRCLTKRLQGLLKVMNSRLNNIRYQGYLGARVLANDLLSDKVSIDNNRNLPMLPDILNAAWICRLESPGEYQTRDIDRKSLDLCVHLAKSSFTEK
jgi:hypothetical protein